MNTNVNNPKPADLPQLSEQNRAILENPRAIIDKFLAEPGENQSVEIYRQQLKDRFNNGFKPNVKYLRAIRALGELIPDLEIAFLCFELSELENNPKLYGQVQKDELLFKAARVAKDLQSPVAHQLATLSPSLFRDLIDSTNDGATIERLCLVRPPEDLPAATDRLGYKFTSILYQKFAHEPKQARDIFDTVSELIKALDQYSDPAFAAQVFESASKFDSKVVKRLLRMFAYLSVHHSEYIRVPSDTNQDEVSFDNSIVFGNDPEDVRYLEKLLILLKPHERDQLRNLIKDFLGKYPFFEEAVNALRVEEISILTRKNLSKQLKYTNDFLEDLEALENNLQEPQVQLSLDSTNIYFTHYYSPSTSRVIRFPHLRYAITLDEIYTQVLVGKNFSYVESLNAPKSLVPRVQALKDRLEIIAEKVKVQIAKKFEDLIPEIVANACKNYQGKNVDNLEKTKEKIQELDNQIKNIQNNYSWNDKIFPDQMEKVKQALITAMYQLKAELEISLFPKMLQQKQAKFREAELEYHRSTIEAKIKFLLAKFNLLLNIDTDDIEIDIHSSENGEMTYDHVMDMSILGEAEKKITYEVGADPKFREFKEKAIDLIIPHEVAHLLIHLPDQFSEFKKLHNTEYSNAKTGLTEDVVKLFNHYIQESIVDGVGLDIIFKCGGINSGPVQKSAALMSLSSAMENLRQALDFQYAHDPDERLVNDIRMLAIIDILIEDVEKNEQAEEFFSGLYHSRQEFIKSLEKANQDPDLQLSATQITNIRNLMKKAIKHGQTAKYSNPNERD
ncbi:hypothetical protein IT412_00050 [Candidatus Peregrinibacteria bacterium]|nr:hypothetical protein [Candidatus Peregrinibacteria bacterium]